MSTLTAVKTEAEEFAALTEAQVAQLNPYDLNVYTTWLLKQKNLSWSGRIWGTEEDSKQFARVESKFTQTNYVHHN